MRKKHEKSNSVYNIQSNSSELQMGYYRPSSSLSKNLSAISLPQKANSNKISCLDLSQSWKFIYSSNSRKKYNINNLINPIQINLQQKINRIKNKRVEQQIKYKSVSKTIKKKLGRQKQETKNYKQQIKTIFQDWEIERNKQSDRYKSRLRILKIK